MTSVSGTTQTPMAAAQTAAQIAAIQAASSKPATGSTKSNTELDQDAFLKLLVAQLKNQDPDKPMDASQMISQSAQLSVVDKLNGISETLKTNNLTDSMVLAGSVIGKSVTFKDKDGATQTATVTSAKFIDTGLVLSAGAWDVPMSSVTAMGSVPVTPTSTTGTSSTGTAGTSSTGTTGTSTGTTGTTGTSSTGTTGTGTSAADAAAAAATAANPAAAAAAAAAAAGTTTSTAASTTTPSTDPTTTTPTSTTTQETAQ